MQTHISTAALANALHVKPNTPRAAYCRDGHYMGIVPVKMPNRLLMWPADAVVDLLAGRWKTVVAIDPIGGHVNRKVGVGAINQSQKPDQLSGRSTITHGATLAAQEISGEVHISACRCQYSGDS